MAAEKGKRPGCAAAARAAPWGEEAACLFAPPPFLRALWLG